MPNIQEAVTDLDINTDVPATREIIQAINSLKNGKAPGHDNLKAELFKAAPKLAATTLTPLVYKDMGTGRNSDRLEKRSDNQDTKERVSK